jgi:hypothetical protein
LPQPLALVVGLILGALGVGLALVTRASAARPAQEPATTAH